MLREVHQFHPNVGCRQAAGHLRTKGVEVRQERLRLTLKNLKNSEPIPMYLIRSLTHKKISTNAT